MFQSCTHENIMMRAICSICESRTFNSDKMKDIIVKNGLFLCRFLQYKILQIPHLTVLNRDGVLNLHCTVMYEVQSLWNSSVNKCKRLKFVWYTTDGLMFSLEITNLPIITLFMWYICTVSVQQKCHPIPHCVYQLYGTYCTSALASQ